MNMHSLIGLALSLALVALAAVALHPRGQASAAPPELIEGVPAEPVEKPPRVAPVSQVAAQPNGPRSAPASKRSARSSFTEVEAGEDLAAVAERVYGARTDRDRLWKANRDLLASPDSPLAVGTILRTP